MKYLKKTILLSDKNSSRREKFATLIIQRNSYGTMGQLKLFSDYDTLDLVLGLSVDNKQVFKQNVVLDNNLQYIFKLVDDFDINAQIGCVLVRKRDGQIEPLVWGSAAMMVDYKTKVIESLKELTRGIADLRETEKQSRLKERGRETLSSLSEKKETERENLQNSKKSFLRQNAEIAGDFNNKKAVDKLIHNNLAKEEIEEEAHYFSPDSFSEMEELEERVITLEDDKNAFASLFETNDNELDEIINEEMDESFYDLISEQVDDLFAKYPSEKKLDAIVPNSKWVRVDADNNGKNYVIGLIYDGDEIKYICYGVPGQFSTSPPANLESYSQWLPTDISDVKGNGYWVMYQDAKSGESIDVGVV